MRKEITIKNQIGELERVNQFLDEIAAELNLSPCTINRHRENIKAKLKLRSVAELVNYWHENNLK